MADVPLSLSCWDYDRTRALLDGRVRVPGVGLRPTVLRPEQAFARAFTTAEFDVSELSYSNHMTAFSNGKAAYTAIPVFLSRAFRHSIIFVRKDRGIELPADLKGRTIGTTEYDMTAALVVRGLLRDEYGVQPADLRWRIGDLAEPERATIPIPTVTGVDIKPLASGTTLESELARGALDAVIALRPPRAFAADDGTLRRLFPDWRRAEQDYVAKTGIFPIMHVVGIRKTLLTAHPWLARAFYDAFEQAKQIAIADLAIIQAPRVTLPWVVAELESTRAVLGADFWPYGVRRNRRTLEAIIRWSFEEGLSNRHLTIDELFAPDTLEL
ncbi:MAG: ABC transporter substrate-binding protein [Alphaproteobacteria bacterium]|nr:ABC transporter substrate-binding protein [Alphaproteobacteria bacterium]